MPKLLKRANKNSYYPTSENAELSNIADEEESIKVTYQKEIIETVAFLVTSCDCSLHAGSLGCHFKVLFQRNKAVAG